MATWPDTSVHGRLRHELRAAGLGATICTPAADGRGKDWSERWRLAEWEGVLPVLDALDALRCPPERAMPVSTPATEPADDEGSPPAPWLADAVVRYLLEHGLTLADARLVQAAPEQPVLVETAS